MAKVFLKCTLTGFVPADEASAEIKRRYKVGEVYKAEIVKPRSYEHHKLCMALLNLTFENQETYTNFDLFRKAVAVAAGYTIEYPDLNGEIRVEAGSLSYDSLDEVEFTKVMASMMTVCANVLHGIDAHELAAQVAIYADQHYGVAA